MIPSQKSMKVMMTIGLLSDLKKKNVLAAVFS
jgi:hypothetical protein